MQKAPNIDWFHFEVLSGKAFEEEEFASSFVWFSELRTSIGLVNFFRSSTSFLSFPFKFKDWQLRFLLGLPDAKSRPLKPSYP